MSVLQVQIIFITLKSVQPPQPTAHLLCMIMVLIGILMNISIAFLEINLNVFNVTLILTITLVVSLRAILIKAKIRNSDYKCFPDIKLVVKFN